MDAGGQGTLATTNENRPEQELTLVDQTLGDGLAGELASEHNLNSRGPAMFGDNPAH